jgi:CRP/FNR family transcriptional regulator, dissimilatory nitrate respiration regulator
MDYLLLQKAPLFNNLSIGEIEKVLSEIPFRIRRYRAGSMIAQSGEPVISLMIVVKGMVKGEMTDYSGKVIKIEDVAAPGAPAAAFLFGRNNRFPVNVISVTETEILNIEKADFLKLLMVNDRVLVNYLDMISNRSQFLSEKIRFLNFRTIKSKLAQYILRLSGGSKRTIRLDRTQNDLADFFGVARPSVARAVSELEEEGIIIAAGKDIEILDRIRLSELTSDQAGIH